MDARDVRRGVVYCRNAKGECVKVVRVHLGPDGYAHPDDPADLPLLAEEARGPYLEVYPTDPPHPGTVYAS